MAQQSEQQTGRFVGSRWIRSNLELFLPPSQCNKVNGYYFTNKPQGPEYQYSEENWLFEYYKVKYIKVYGWKRIRQVTE